MRKKRVLIHSNFAGAPTGFGNFTKRLLSHLYKTGKYELANYAGGYPSNARDHLKFPWKTYPAIPLHRQDLISRANQDPHFGKMLSYGEPTWEDVIKDFKPDVYIGAEDFWAFGGIFDSPLFSKINSVIYWTADSLPILEEAVNKAPKIKHHYVWSGFAEREFHRLAKELEGLENKNEETLEKIASYKRVKTLNAPVDDKQFFRLSEYERKDLRAKYNVPENAFVIGTLSRNQLRKSFGVVIEAFSLFKKENPNVNAKLSFFTSFREGWNIPRFAKQYGVDINDILAVYRCKTTGETFVLPYSGENIQNPKTGQKDSLMTVGLDNFATESQINEWYNLLDVFTLPITSGGLELGSIQAKLCELITLINDYSCFEDQCVPEAGSITLDWTKTYEIGTQFIKAVVSPYSLMKALNKVYKMPRDKKREQERQSRKWALENYSVEVCGKKFEDLIDSFSFVDEINFNIKKDLKNPNAEIPEEKDDTKWIISLYKILLNCDVDANNDGVKHWLNNISRGQPRNQIVDFFRQTAAKDNSSHKIEITPEEFLRSQGVKENAVLVCFKESAGDVLLLTSLFKSLRQQYPNNQLVVSVESKYRELLDGNSYIDLVINYAPFLDNQLLLQGIGTNKPLIHKSLHPRNGSQLAIDYLGADNISFDLFLKN